MDLKAIPLGMATVLAGAAAAALHGNFELMPTILCLAFAVSIQICANLYHRYYDLKHHYGESIDLDQSYHKGGLSLEKVVHESAQAFGLISLTIGLGILCISSLWTLIAGALVYSAIYLQYDGPRPYARKAWSLLPCFLFFGPVGVIATSYVCCSYENHYTNFWFELGPSVWLGIAMGMFAVNALLCYNFINRRQDVENEKKTFVSRYGIKFSTLLVLVNDILILALSALIVWTNDVGTKWIVISIPVLCTIFNLYVWYGVVVSKDIKSATKLSWYNNINAMFYAFSGLLIFYYTGIADDSVFRLF